MSVKSGRLPSPGFVAILVVYAAAASFFVWALHTPPLQRVWEIHHLLKIGELDQLDKADHRLLERAMDDYPKLARDLLDGHAIGIVSAHLDGWIAAPDATLIRTADSASVRELEIDVQAPVDALPIEILVRGAGFEERREATAHGIVTVPLPAPGDEPEIVEVSLRANESDGGSMPGVRITWEDRP